ncbi:hypothetical protein M1307_01220 [Patescibacteria group bacterium]|nr:hypothetical protein [Patescibacteria group bacterium]
MSAEREGQLHDWQMSAIEQYLSVREAIVEAGLYVENPKVYPTMGDLLEGDVLKKGSIITGCFRSTGKPFEAVVIGTSQTPQKDNRTFIVRIEDRILTLGEGTRIRTLNGVAQRLALEKPF